MNRKVKKIVNVLMITIILMMSGLSTSVTRAEETKTNETISLGLTMWRDNTQDTYYNTLNGPLVNKVEVRTGNLIGYITGSDHISGSENEENRSINIGKVVKQQGSQIDTSAQIYCLKAEKGFADVRETTTTSGIEYNKKYNLYNDKQAIMNELEIQDEATYNKIIWILENMYVKSDDGDTSARDALLEESGATKIIDSYKANIKSASEYWKHNFEYEGLGLTDSDIEVVQQMALWYYTNGGRYQTKGLGSLAVTFKDKYSDEDPKIFETFAARYDYTAFGDEPINIGTARQKACEELWNHLVNTAETKVNAGWTPTRNINATFWTYEGDDGVVRQPVVIVEKEEKVFDLALRKFITKVNDTEYIKSYYRVPEITAEANTPRIKNGETTLEKGHTKIPVTVKTGDIVTYTIRIYNEGDISGYAQEVTDYLPEGLEFLPDSTINKKYGWKCYDGKTVTTDYLKYVQNKDDNLIKAFDKNAQITDADINTDTDEQNPDYRDLQIECKVIEENSTAEKTLINVAEITKAKDENGNDIEDIDSTPKNLNDEQKQNYNPGESEKGWGYEDDDDYEKLLLPGAAVDFSLRKFITAIGDTELKDSEGNYLREPEVLTSTIEDTKTATYNHPKDPLTVAVGDIVTYTIRVYNEGDIDGYVSEITDHLPKWLEFISDKEKYPEEAEFNSSYLWDVTSSTDGRTIKTTITSKASTDTYDTLTGEKRGTTLLEAWDGTENVLDYIDVKVKCKVIGEVGQEVLQQGTKITNIADITGMTDVEGHVLNSDRDSKVNNVNLPSDEELPEYKQSLIDANRSYIEGQEDDDDFEKLIIQVFDLRLRKFITGVQDNKYVETSSVPETYEGFDVSGKIEIEKINLNLNILSEYTKKSLEKSCAILQSDGLNQIGNTVIGGHNYADGTIFSNNEKLEIGDKIVITDRNGKIGNYTIDNKFVVPASDFSYVEPVEEGKVEITLSTNVTNDNENRLIIHATAESIEDEKKSITVTQKGEYREITDRYPEVSYSDNPTSNTNILDYKHLKIESPVSVVKGNIVTYTIRVYNEGEIAGYAEEITDYLEDEGLKYLPDHEINKSYRWKMVDDNGNEVTDVENATKVVTDYLSKARDDAAGILDGYLYNCIKPFDKTKDIIDDDVKIDYETVFGRNAQNPDYRDVKIAFEVVEENESQRILVNTAEISDDADSEGNEVTDVDSDPDRIYDNEKENEDDYDKDYVRLTSFDLALRKFITGVNDMPVNNRYPDPTYDETLKRIVYNHPKTPVEVAYQDVVTYTIRVYNEGTMDGYAQEVADDLPEYLTYLPDHEINQKYGWKLRDKDGNIVENLEDAVCVTTDYLSKENGEEITVENEEGTTTTVNSNLLKAFNKDAGISETNPDYREVQIAMRVDLQVTGDNLEDSKRILINEAQISEDADENGEEVKDIDSNPNRDDEYNYDGDNEDDIDYEPVKVKYFDLALKKWVTQAIVTENGKTTVTESGHTGDENPEPAMKVEIKSKSINKVTVKFKFSIKVTNQGEIAGYAKEVTDHIPEGLKFVKEDNPDWYEKEGNLVATRALENTLLEPGESATVEIVLQWINGNENFGLKTNYAEISEDQNSSNTPDIDSVPGNFENKPDEDDEDEAPVVLSIKTGGAPMYFALTSSVIGMFAGGVLMIKKYVI